MARRGVGERRHLRVARAHDRRLHAVRDGRGRRSCSPASPPPTGWRSRSSPGASRACAVRRGSALAARDRGLVHRLRVPRPPDLSVLPGRRVVRRARAVPRRAPRPESPGSRSWCCSRTASWCRASRSRARAAACVHSRATSRCSRRCSSLRSGPPRIRRRASRPPSPARRRCASRSCSRAAIPSAPPVRSRADAERLAAGLAARAAAGARPRSRRSRWCCFPRRRSSGSRRARGIGRCRRLAQRFGIEIWTGGARTESGSEGAPRYFNSAFRIRADGGIDPSYDKNVLVPFGEAMPLGGAARLALGRDRADAVHTR